ncbi:MAG TPA: ABC transporter substrate-binding protein [Candidatus Nanopelagicales bacterium]|nr:ABC transporter substrate-binding protein [Candidatus Nanopelagicales bacterium]
MRTLSRSTRVSVGAAVAALALGLGITVSAAASSSSSSSSPSASKTVFTVGITQDIDSANPFTGVVAEAYEIYQMEYPTLTEYSAKDFSITPGLAESWQESADHTTWTYKIRAGLKWSDGQPLTAKDAAYTFNRILKGEYEKTNFGSYVENITKAEAPDDTTLVLTVSKPTPIMTKLAVYILPQHIWEKIDEKAVTSYKNEGTPDSPTVGAGPYVMVERKVGQFIRMQANPNFYRGKPAVDEVVFKIYSNADALGQALKKGEIDFADSIEANVFKTLQNQPGITAVNAVYSGFDELAFNTGAALDDGTPIGDGNPLLKDKALRQALGWAIDRKALVDKVLGGGGSPGSTIIPPLYSALHLAPANEVTYDPEKAKTLLDAAGYKAGADGIRADSKGNKLSFRLFARSDSDTSQKSVQFIKSYLEAVGVETTVKVVSSDALTEIIGQGKYDMFEWGWVVEPDPNYQLSTFTCANRSYKDGGQILANLSDSFYCNPAYDELYAKQGGQTDETQRWETVKQMQQMLYDDAPYIITYYYDNPEAYRSDRFTGFVPQPDPNGSLLFQYGTWSYENLKPVTADSGSSSGSSSSNTALYVFAALAALVVIAIVVVVLSRRNRTAADIDDRE